MIPIFYLLANVSDPRFLKTIVEGVVLIVTRKVKNGVYAFLLQKRLLLKKKYIYCCIKIASNGLKNHRIY